jgi:hypothetical protein
VRERVGELRAKAGLQRRQRLPPATRGRRWFVRWGNSEGGRRDRRADHRDFFVGLWADPDDPEEERRARITQIPTKTWDVKFAATVGEHLDSPMPLDDPLLARRDGRATTAIA